MKRGTVVKISIVLCITIAGFIMLKKIHRGSAEISESNILTRVINSRSIDPADNITVAREDISSEPYIDTDFGSFKCSHLIRGRNISTDRVEEKVTLLKNNILPDESFINLTSDCNSFAYSRGYLGKPVTYEELQFPLAFLILMYKSAHQVEQLLRTIYRPHNVYCIHVDKKSPPELHTAMKAISSCFNNVFVASSLTSVAWGSIGVVQAERYCQKDLLARHMEWKYLINLSGQEFPLKTNLEIVQILQQLQGRNDILSNEGVPVERINHRYEVINNTLTTTEEKRDPTPPNGSPIFFSRYKRWASPKKPCEGLSVRGICMLSWKDLPWIIEKPQLFINKFNEDLDPLIIHCAEEVINNRAINPIRLNVEYYSKIAKGRSWKASTLRVNETWMV
ncbi:beta-1,3-galactosyl-O-glycosyl-glycoprotein beta-1,6-N-acetylglucosaminyltransferase-like [Glandiceps talaboti]